MNLMKHIRVSLQFLRSFLYAGFCWMMSACGEVVNAKDNAKDVGEDSIEMVD